MYIYIRLFLLTIVSSILKKEYETINHEIKRKKLRS